MFGSVLYHTAVGSSLACCHAVWRVVCILGIATEFQRGGAEFWGYPGRASLGRFLDIGRCASPQLGWFSFSLGISWGLDGTGRAGNWLGVMCVKRKGGLGWIMGYGTNGLEKGRGRLAQATTRRTSSYGPWRDMTTAHGRLKSYILGGRSVLPYSTRYNYRAVCGWACHGHFLLESW